MELTETTLSTREIYRGRVIRVKVDQVALPNGSTSSREIVEHPGGVGILALDEDNSVYLVRQYRYAFSRTLLEIPAGKREAGEEPFLTAKRELREEIGATAQHWEVWERSSPLRAVITRCCTYIWLVGCPSVRRRWTRTNFSIWSICPLIRCWISA